MSAAALFSDQWYRVKDLKPAPRRQLKVHRHYYRGAPWYVVEAPSRTQQLRLNDAAYHVFSQLDGARSVDEIWQRAMSTLGDDAPTQQEVINLLAELAEYGMATFGRQSDIDTLFDQHHKRQDRDAKTRYWNPLFMRFALFDPDRLAARIAPKLGWCFSRAALCLWLLLMVVTTAAGAYAWPELSATMAQQALTPRYLIILWFVFPLMKLLHELAHGLAVRYWGGEVHEFGVALLILMPVPYVDASASAAFANKYRRMAVAAAGIVIETTLGALGLFVWLLVEPGLVRDIALNLCVTGFVSSLLFNGNPLLKFDAYYVLADAIEIPNLASRANRYLQYLLQRYALGAVATSPVTAAGERRWFIGYGLLALMYRLTLTFTICLFVASQYFFVGVALALWSFTMQILWPIGKGLRYLATGPALARARPRALAVSATAAAVLAVGLFAVPIPHASAVRGVVWPVDDAIVRSETDCFVEALLIADPAGSVEQDDALLRCDTLLANAELTDLRAQTLAAQAAVRATRNRSEQALRRAELETRSQLLAKAEERAARTTISSGAAGTLYLPRADKLIGSYFEQGELIGYVLSPQNLSVRVLLNQERAALLKASEPTVGLRRLARPDAVHDTEILRTLPTASDQLTVPALGEAGGGALAMDREDPDGARLAEPAFELELKLPRALADARVGEAVMVRIDHGTAPAATLLYRQLQLLLLRRFGV